MPITSDLGNPPDDTQDEHPPAHHRPSIVKLLAMPNGADIEFDPPKLVLKSRAWEPWLLEN
jgi:hypothetical protein